MKANPSRFSLEKVVFFDSTLAAAHVRREAIDADGRVIDPATQSDPQILHEIALYVLAKRDGAWWLAAGQNTPLRKNLPSPNIQPGFA
jgi:hypothetical protein